MNMTRLMLGGLFAAVVFAAEPVAGAAEYVVTVRDGIVIRFESRSLSIDLFGLWHELPDRRTYRVASEAVDANGRPLALAPVKTKHWQQQWDDVAIQPPNRNLEFYDTVFFGLYLLRHGTAENGYRAIVEDLWTIA